jgi:hypothetical protein
MKLRSILAALVVTVFCHSPILATNSDANSQSSKFGMVEMFSHTRVWPLATILALLSCGPFIAASAKAEEDDAALKSRFQALSQHGNLECSVQFEKLIGTMPADGRLQGSCCAPMDESRLAFTRRLGVSSVLDRSESNRSCRRWFS